MDTEDSSTTASEASASKTIRSTRPNRRRYKESDSGSHSAPSNANSPTTANLPPLQRPRVLGIHHLKFAVSNLDVSIAWYERVLGARRIPSLDHVRADGTRFAAVVQLEEWVGLFLELRVNEGQALKDRGWDPVTLVVRGRQDLLGWIDWLDRYGTVHSPLLVGMRGWLLVFEDPDGRRIRMYTRESHGGLEIASADEYWLNDP